MISESLRDIALLLLQDTKSDISQTATKIFFLLLRSSSLNFPINIQIKIKNIHIHTLSFKYSTGMK